MSVPSVPPADQATVALRKVFRAIAMADAARRAEFNRQKEARFETTTRAQVEARARFINDTMSKLSVSLRFQMDERSGTLKILVVDRAGRVVRQVPPDYFMQATAGIAAGGGARGLFFDEGA